ncbi:C-type lectin domain family 2 member B [Tenrec ecaudatus]|uniref:C-type lectin domain family 2 member B n=1 Tax=Tenrec ecaudatus TaxID=94439 RepID=UPI003F5A5B07
MDTDVDVELNGKCPQHVCPDDWIGFRDRCYYFSKEHEGSFDSSSHNCSSLHSNLTTIDTVEEMAFLKHFKCNYDHWIGMTLTKNHTGKWVNGTPFDNWFFVRGSEGCAYLNEVGVAAARCSSERKWICKKKMDHLS